MIPPALLTLLHYLSLTAAAVMLVLLVRHYAHLILTWGRRRKKGRP